MTAPEVIGSALMVAGALLSVLSAWGIVDFPTILSRMHASTKSATLGLVLLSLGAGVAATSWALVGIAALVGVFLFVTSPISGHLLGRAAYLACQAGDLVHDDLAGAGDTRPLQTDQTSRVAFSPTRWALLLMVWMLLWRDVSAGTVVGGAVVATVVEVISPNAKRDTRINVRGLVTFLFRYVAMVGSSNLRVAREVITVSNETIQEAIVAVPLRTTLVPVALLVANAVTFTPGNLTIEMTGHPFTLYVHVLHFRTVDDVYEEIWELERLASRILRDRTTD